MSHSQYVMYARGVVQCVSTQQCMSLPVVLGGGGDPVPAVFGR